MKATYIKQLHASMLYHINYTALYTVADTFKWETVLLFLSP